MSENITTEMIKSIREKTGAGMMDCKKALLESKGNFDEAVDWLRKKGLAAAAKKSSRVAADGLVGIASYQDKVAAIVEVNSETDFVAKNQKFQDFVKKVVDLAARESFPTTEQLLSMKIGQESVQDIMTNLIAVIGENITVRRTAKISVDQGIIATYIHSSIAPGLGKIGVLVGLESSGESEKLKEFGKKLAMHIAASGPRYLNIQDIPISVIEHEKTILLEQIKETGRPPEVMEKMIDGRLRKFYEEVVLNEQAYIMDNKKKISVVIDDFSKELGAPITIKTFLKFVLGEGIEKIEADFSEEVKTMSQLKN